MDKQTSSSSSGAPTGAIIAKCIIVALPASVLPDRFPNHPHLVFGISIITGLVIQHFIPPRGRHFVLLLLVAAILIGLQVLLVK